MKTEEVRDIYNAAIPKAFHGDYEHHRWFHSSLARADHEMTLQSIKFHFLDHQQIFRDYLELGPGAGTWTKYVIEAHPDALFDLTDISREMLALSKEKLRGFPQIRYFEGDFLSFSSDKKYDVFFSSRAIEYIPDTDAVVKKIADLLKENGNGFVITKTPKYLRNQLLGRKISAFHQGQIPSDRLIGVFRKYGFRTVDAYPVTMHFPLLKSPAINRFLYSIFYKFRLNFLSKFFAESYCVYFSRS